MLRLYDRVKQATATSGSGNLTIGTSVPGFNVFSDFYNTGDLTYYVIEDLDNNEFEVGIGTYSGAFLTRDSVLTSSSSGNLVNLEGNTNTFVFATYAASGSVYTSGDRIITNVDGSDFNLGSTPEYKEGRIFYDSTNHALAVYNDESEITLQVGQENYIRVRNNTGSTITNGQAVKIEGSQGTNTTVVLAIATGDLSSQAIGLATHDIEDSSFGYITTFGMVNDLDTSDFLDGDEVFLSDVVSGGLTGVSPTAPSYQVPLGHVVRSHPSVGNILVQPGFAKLGGGDVKSLGDIQKSGVPFLDIIANGGSAAILSSDPSFRFDSGNNVLYVPNIDVSGDLSASNGAGTSGQLLMSQGDDQPTVWTDAPSSTGISQGVAFFDSQNVLTGESEFSYDSGNNTLYVDNITLSGNITNPQDTASSEAFGNQAVVSGVNNSVAIGYQSLAGGYESVAMGSNASAGTYWNVAIGYNAKANGAGGHVVIGHNAACSGAFGNSVVIGKSAGENAGSLKGYESVMIGAYACRNSSTRSTVAIGVDAGRDCAGDFGTFLGNDAGRNSNGETNLLLGQLAGRNLVGDSNVAIGTSALFNQTVGGSLEILVAGQSSSVNVDNTINIADLIRGNHVDGILGINTDLSPEAALHVDTPNSTTTTSIFRGALSQSTNLTEWQDSAGGELAFVDYSGNASFQDLFAQNFTVTGTFTYLNSQNVTILDKQLELASDSGTAISGDAAVDEGGIVLKSLGGDKEWVWRDSTDAWTTNQNIDVGSNAVIFNGVSQTQAFLGNASVSGTPSGIAFYGPTSGITDDPELYYDSSSNILYVDNITSSGVIHNPQASLSGDAFGIGATVENGANYPLAVGYNSIASGNASVAIGPLSTGVGGGVAIGEFSYANGTAVAVGVQAKADSSLTTAIGYQAGKDEASFSNNSTWIGAEAGKSQDGNDNTLIGYYAGGSSIGDSQTTIGSFAGVFASGAESISIGNFSRFNADGTQCIAIGQSAGQTADGDRQVCIGYNAGRNATASRIIDINSNGPVTSPLNGYDDSLNIGSTILGDTSLKKIGIGGHANPSTIDSTLHVISDSSPIVTSTFQAAVGQAVNVTEWQDSSSAIMASVGPEGTISTTGSIHVFNSGDIDGFDYERLEIKWDANVATIDSTAAGAGIQRRMNLNAADLVFQSSGVNKFLIDPSINYSYQTLQPGTGSTYTLGASPRRWSTTYTDGFSTNVETYGSGSVLLDDKNNVVLGDCTSGALTVNLQTAVGRRGLQYHIKKIDSSANTLTIDADGTETIDGQLTQVLNTQYQSLTIVSDDSNWFII